MLSAPPEMSTALPVVLLIEPEPFAALSTIAFPTALPASEAFPAPPASPVLIAWTVLLEARPRALPAAFEIVGLLLPLGETIVKPGKSSPNLGPKRRWLFSSGRPPV
jgi:hypothetical protein